MELNPDWEYVADTVMGGVSSGQLTQAGVAGKSTARLTGKVLLDNNGGFIQMVFDLDEGQTVDVSGWRGIEIDVRGNGATYEMRLRTDQLSRPWQSFRAGFVAPQELTTHRLPFDGFEAHRTDESLDRVRSFYGQFVDESGNYLD